MNDLHDPYPITPAQQAAFREQGFIKLKNVLTPATLARYGQAISDEVARRNTMTKPMAQRTTYEKAFLQIMNIWEESPVVREFVFSRRLARLAAELMGVAGVRLYHDQALYKEPGGGLTPWHADQYYWPVSTDNTCTAWVPLQPTPLEMGPLAFSAGSHRYNVGRELEISDESETRISKELLERGLPNDKKTMPAQRGFESVGPDLREVARKRSRQELLESLLEPSKHIERPYMTYIVQTTSGRVQTGLLVRENDREIVLRDTQAKDSVLLRADIELLQTSPKSLMPDALLRDLTAQEAADLLSFLESLKLLESLKP